MKIGDRVIINEPENELGYQHYKNGEEVIVRNFSGGEVGVSRDGLGTRYVLIRKEYLLPAKFNIGDKFLCGKDKVEVVGYMRGTNEGAYVKRKDNTVFFSVRADLKPIPVPLLSGQECWVKMNFYSYDLEGNIILNYRDYVSDEESITIKSTHEILLKDSNGRLVPYENR